MIQNRLIVRAPHRTVYGNGRTVGGSYTVTDRILRFEMLDTARYGHIRQYGRIAPNLPEYLVYYIYYTLIPP